MNKWKRGLLTLAALPLLFVVLTAESCDTSEQKLKDQAEYSEDIRADTLERAQSLYPLPKTENYPLREALVKFTLDQDKLGSPVYTYVLSDVGTIIYYVVSETYPVNICAFLSTTSNQYDLPSLDGIYYGGSGAAAACDGYFVYDTNSGALIELIGMKIFISSAPLDVDAPRLEISAQ